MSAEKELGARVYVLESKQEEFDRRQRDQEDRQQVQIDLINSLASNTAIMNHTLSMLTDKIIPKVEDMEKKVEANTMVTKAAVWVTGAVITASFAAFVALI